MYVRKEAVLSSQIEGTQSSLQDLLAAEAQVAEGLPGDVDEVVNYVRAMNLGLARLNELPVSIRLIREIHHELLQGARGSQLTPGQLRQSQNWIGPGGSTIATATFIPPPPHDVPALLGDVETFLHREDDVPLLIKIGLAHAQFETIHPFLDGNGRIGRLLITFLLCERKVLQKPVLYLSYFFKQHREEYYDRLQAIRDKGDWEGWLTFFLAAWPRLASKPRRQRGISWHSARSIDDKITDRLGRAAGNGHRLLEQLYEKPIVSVNDVRAISGTTFPSANQIVQRLVDLGILKEITGHARHRRFQYEPYVALFRN